MAEADLQRFLEKVRQLQAFVALSERDASLRDRLASCSHHREVVDLARSCGFEIGRRWGDDAAPQAADGNLLAAPKADAGQEITTLLQAGSGWRLERIHSCRSASPPGFWYDQAEEEWVCLLQGSARLRFADEARPRELNRGDWLHIPAHQRHRIEETEAGAGTVWLALFWSEPPPASSAGAVADDPPSGLSS